MPVTDLGEATEEASDYLPLSEQALHLEEVPRRLAKLFAAAGFRTWGDIASLQVISLLRTRGVGSSGLSWVRREVARRKMLPRTPSLPPPFLVAYGPLPVPRYRSGVYFIQCQEFVKIGLARDVQRRFVQLRQGIPFRCRLIGVVPAEPPQTLREVERDFHQRFKAYHHIGEWFTRDGALGEFCRDLERLERIRASEV